MSLTLSLCQYVCGPRRGFGQTSLSLEASRLQALEIRQLFYQQNRKLKIFMIKASRYMGLVLGSFLAPQTDMILETELGPPLKLLKASMQVSNCSVASRPRGAVGIAALLCR